jgi:hypothetical protein
MVGNFDPNEVFIVVKDWVENANQLDVTNFNNSGDEAEVATNLLNIANIFYIVLNLILTTSINTFEPTTYFYVVMPQNPTTPTNK